MNFSIEKQKQKQELRGDMREKNQKVAEMPK